MKRMAEYVGGESVAVDVGDPITFENKTDDSFSVDVGIVFRKSGLYRVTVDGKHTSVEIEPERWTPCYDPSELPKNMPLWATFDDGDGYRYVCKVFYDMTEWSRDVSNVIAYMEYEEPKPYGDKE